MSNFDVVSCMMSFVLKLEIINWTVTFVHGVLQILTLKY